MRIGLLGGSFNPVHNGHIAIAKAALKELDLDRVLFIPVYIPPHKGAEGLIDAQGRYRMLELAAEKEPKFEISRYEIDKKQVSYSIDTLRYLKGAYPTGTEFFFLIGSDSLNELDTWKDIEQLKRLCRFAVCHRPGFDTDEGAAGIVKIEMEPFDISSTQIRSYVKEGRPIKGLLPEKVEEYIEGKRLYK